MKSTLSTEMKWETSCWEWQLIRLVTPQPTLLPMISSSWEPTSLRGCGKILTTASELIFTPRSSSSNFDPSTCLMTMKMRSRRQRWQSRAFFWLRPRETRTKLNSKPKWNKHASPKTLLLTRLKDAHSQQFWGHKLRLALSSTLHKRKPRHTRHLNKIWLWLIRSWSSTYS